MGTPIGNLGVNVSVPLAGFGSTGDASCTAETKAIFEASPVFPKLFRNEVGWSHLEPLSVPVIAKYNPPLGLMTAAWFKILTHFLLDVTRCLLDLSSIFQL